MRILLDECLPRRLKFDLVGHEVDTVPEAGWAGKRNGELLRLAARAHDAFLTKEWTFLWRRLMGVSRYELGDVGDVNGDGCSDLRSGRDEILMLESGCGGEILSTTEGQFFGTSPGDADGDGHADLLRLTNPWEPEGPDHWKDGLLEVVSGKEGNVLVRVDESSLSRAR